MSYANARIYDLGDDFEAKYHKSGWSTSKGSRPAQAKPKTARGKSINYARNREKAIFTARGEIRRKIKKFKLDRFLTLTFVVNIPEVKITDAFFRNFVKRVKHRHPEFKYVCTREFQERGAAHYHLAMNIYIPKDELDELWGHGWTYVEKVKSGRKKIYHYLCKYLTKYSSDERLNGFHLYLTAQGLNIVHTDKRFSSLGTFLVHLFSNYQNAGGKFHKHYADVGLYVVI